MAVSLGLINIRSLHPTRSAARDSLYESYGHWVVGLLYRFDVLATDPNADLLSYGVNGPAGMTIDAFGRTSWVPQPTQVGTNEVLINSVEA